MKIVKRDEFVNFALEDAEDFYANKDIIVESLKEQGVFKIEVLFNTCGYVPGKLILNEEIDEEFYPGINCRLETLEEYKKRTE